MAFAFRVLESSSAGNCALLESSECRVLIDAGLSCRRIGAKLEALGLRLEDLDSVFITHEHHDHIQGLRGLSRYPGLRVFANGDTAQALNGKFSRNPRWQIFETGSAFGFADLEIASFRLPHDSYDPVGFVIRCRSGGDLFHRWQSAAWVVDLGYIPRLVSDRVRDVELLVLEANHDLDLLEADTRRPWSTKQRIRGRHGHLSNDAVCTFLEQAEDVSWRQVMLGHLSRDCNNLDRLRHRLTGNGACRVPVSVIDPANHEGPAIQHAMT